MVQLVSAAPMLAQARAVRSPSAAHTARSSPASAAAPTIFSTTSVPATPRRLDLPDALSTATSSWTRMLALFPAKLSAAISKFITSPA